MRNENFLQIYLCFQEVDRTFTGRHLNANELKTTVSLLRTVAEDAKMQPVLDKLRARGGLSVVGLTGSLIPLHHAVHAHSAPRILLQRYIPLPGINDRESDPQ